MTPSATAQQVREWSEQVARDPGSLAFFPLAEAYRDQGRGDAALRLCLRGLEHHPSHVGAHFLLGLLYRDTGDTVRAFDEWDITLRLDPEHRGARRELGLLCAEQGEWNAARRYLEAVDDPADERVATALAHLRRQTESAPAVAAQEATANLPVAPPAGVTPGRGDGFPNPFAAVAEEPGVRGAVLLDAQGLLLAGEMGVGGRDRAPEVAAALRGVSDDAEHAVRHLELGNWSAILLETAEHVVHLVPVNGTVLAVATGRELPLGWAVRLAGHARDSAELFLAGGEADRGKR